MKTEIMGLRLQEREMEIAVFGSGPQALVMLPGMSLHSVLLSAEAVAAAYAALGEKYRIYLPDLPTELPPDYSIEALAEDVGQALALLGVRQACVFGVSMGGMAALSLTLRRPDLVQRLVLGSTSARPAAYAGSLLAQWTELARRGAVRELNRSFREAVYSEATLEKYSAVFAADEDKASAGELERFRIMAEACKRFDCAGALQQIRCPALVIGARQDRIFPPAAAEELAAGLGCGLYLYEEYGHGVYDEAPDYKKRLAEFCERQEASMRKRIGLVVAIEIDSVLEKYGAPELTEDRHGYTVRVYRNGEYDLYVAEAGAGEIGAAGAAQMLISAYQADLILNFGVVGALTEEISVAELCVVERVIHYDFDTSGWLDLPVGQYPGKASPYLYPAPELVEAVTAAAPEIRRVTCASADKFVSEPARKRALREAYGADICEMEAAGVVLTCERNGVPCLLIKAISDSLTGGGREFLAELKRISAVCFDVVDRLLQRLRL